VLLNLVQYLSWIIVSQGMRLRHLKQIAKRKLTASEAESENSRDVKTSSEVQSLEIQDSFKDPEECFSTDYVGLLWLQCF